MSDEPDVGAGCILSAIMLVVGILIGCHGLGTIINAVTSIIGHQ
jgi:hypothetical protein